MFRLRLIVLCCLLCSVTAHSQMDFGLSQDSAQAWFRRYIDSLPILVREGRTRIYNSFCRAADHFDYKFTSSQWMLSAGALYLNKKDKDEFARMYALNYLAVINYNQQKYATSTRFWLEALAIAKERNFGYEELHVYRRALNNNYFYEGDYGNAMKISTEGLARSEILKDTESVAHFENVIGFIHMKQKNFEQAERYFTAYLTRSRQVNDTLIEAHALYNLADLAIARQRYDSAILLLDQSMKVYRSIRITALFTLKEREAYINNKIAEAWKLKGDFPKALSFSLSAAVISDKNTVPINLYDKAGYFIQTGEIYNLLHLPDSAIFYLRKGLHISKDIRHRENLRDAFRQLSASFSQKKLYDSAFSYLRDYAQLKDSIDHDSNQREILQREADLNLARQEAVQQVALERQKNWRNIILILSLAILLALFFLYYRNRLKQKNKYQQELNRQQNELFNAISTAQEQERKRIAQDIHDGLGSVLSAAKLKMAEVKESKPGLADDPKFVTGIGLIDEAAAELRNISHNIMPATLSKLGLVPALKSLCDIISSGKGPEITFISFGIDQRLHVPVELSLYRIVFELVNNLVKHSGATKATVQLMGHAGYVNLVVEDNGSGFRQAAATGENSGIGLGNVAARVEYLKGKMDIDSMPGKGTTIIIDIPLNAN